jgi:NAD(P) transhydrogenase
MTTPDTYDLVCLGSGPAGQKAAVQAAKLGYRAAVVERSRCVGGVCIQTGTIPSKTFREAVRTLTARPPLSRLDGFDRPRVDMKKLIERVDDVILHEQRVVEAQLLRNGIDVHRGVGTFVDAKTIVVRDGGEERVLRTRNTLIAVGTRPARPNGVPVDGRTIVDSDQVLLLPDIPRTMVVVGGGVIGVEYATMFAALGVKVTLIDKRPKPLEFLDAEIVDELIHQMRTCDVTFRCCEAVKQVGVVEDHGPHGVIELESGKHIVADVILYSIGRTGRTDDLGLDAIALKLDDRGRITVDEHYKTAIDGVYAAGDVIGYPALAATSSEQGRLAACHMFGATAEPMVAHFPIGIYSIPEISMVGATEEQLTAQKVPYEIGVARYNEIARGNILGDDAGMCKLIFHRETRKLLGVHCIGSGATELVHVGQAVLGLSGGLDYFLTTVFNYPTLAECYKVAAYNAANKLRYANMQPSPTPSC